jgi:nucleotide-binding universal stress UspA family protein
MYQVILVPLDGSKRAEEILPHVRSLATVFQSQIVLLNVVDPVPVAEEGMFVVDIFQEQQSEMDRYLEGVRTGPMLADCRVETRVVVGPVVSTIMNVAENVHADLIAFASHGRTGLQRVFYGSVAASLLHRADRPLLLVRAL